MVVQLLHASVITLIACASAADLLPSPGRQNTCQTAPARLCITCLARIAISCCCRRADARRLAKRDGSLAIRSLREAGVTPRQVRERLGVGGGPD